MRSFELILHRFPSCPKPWSKFKEKFSDLKFAEFQSKLLTWKKKKTASLLSCIIWVMIFGETFEITEKNRYNHLYASLCTNILVL